MHDIVSVMDFGAIGDGIYHPLSEQYLDLATARVKYPFVTSLVQSIDWAACQKAVNTGKVAWAPKGVYVWTDTLRMKSAQWLVCEGVDSWEHLDPSIRKKNDYGTHFIMYGDIAKQYTCYGATDMRTAGGVRENPDSINSLDTQYALTSFHNDDASNGVESTLRQFSVAIYVEPGSQCGGIRNFRVHPNFDGINGYNDRLTTGLGDACDVGVFMDNCPHFTMDTVQCVGYWRIRGALVGCITRNGAHGANYFTKINGCTIQNGLEIRGGDQSKILATTSSTIDAPWADNHPYKNKGTLSTPRGTFTYTSTSKVVGTPNGTVLRFNGVSPDPSEAVLGSGPIRISSGSGLGGMMITGGNVITGLDHTSMLLSSNPLIGLGVSTALMISGTFRQPWFSQTYIQTREDVVAHFHACDDIRMSQCQFEANDYRTEPGGAFSPTHGGRVIASPQDTSSPFPAASGDTSLSLYQHHCAPYVDLFPKVARAAGSKFSRAGLFNPRRLQYPDLQVPDSDHLDLNPLLTQNLRVNLAPATQMQVRDSAGTTLVSVSESTGSLSIVKGQLSLPASTPGFINAGAGQPLYLRQGSTVKWQINAAGSFNPGTDGTQNLAASNARINSSFFAVAPTVTSDKHLKKLRGSLTSVEIAAWASVQAKVYQMLDMVAEKGEDAARWHVGYVAQEVQQAFIEHGLDPSRYALWCQDPTFKSESKVHRAQRQKVELVNETKEVIDIRDGVPTQRFVIEQVEHPVTESVAIVDELGNQIVDRSGHPRCANVPVMEEYEETVEVLVKNGTRLGLRYEQCLVFDVAYLRSLLIEHDQRIRVLENACSQ